MAPNLVLLVDDFAAQRDIFATALLHAGYQVLHACTGSDAIERAHAAVPSLVILDLRLPNRSGVEVRKILREHPKTRDIPVLAVTADTVSYPAVKVLALGFAGYLSKPVLPSRLLAVVRDLIGPAVPEPPMPVE